MPPPKALTAAMLLFLLTSCGVSTRSAPKVQPTVVVVERPRLPPLPARLEEPCEDPARLPDRDLTFDEFERYWAQDRLALAECGPRHKGLVRFYRKREAALAAP
jgi:hypothetical protein